MTIDTTEATALLDWYPVGPSNIHGRLHVSRIASFMPTLVEFFKANKELVPAQFQAELNSLTEADIVNWQRVAMLRASGRYDTTTTIFQDKGRGSTFAEQSRVNCFHYLRSKNLSASEAQTLSNAITEVDLNPSSQPESLLGWMLKHATQLETLRDQKNKDFSVTDLPAWQQAQGKPQLTKKLESLATSHYQLINQQQGFACVSLLDENRKRLYPSAVDDENTDRQKLSSGKSRIHDAGKSKDCFKDTQQAVQNYYRPVLRPAQAAAPTATAVAPPAAAKMTPLPAPQTTTTSPAPKVTTRPGSMSTFVSAQQQDPKVQAENIWATQVEPLLKDGTTKVGLIYSANNKQAERLHTANETNASPNGIIDGAGQALLFKELAKIIAEKKMTARVHILPITTSVQGEDNTLEGNQVTTKQIDRDLDAIASAKKNGFEIRGLGTANGQYSIGGGVSQGWNNPKVAHVVTRKGDTISQGQYVQQSLENIAVGQPFVASTPTSQPNHQPTVAKDWQAVRERGTSKTSQQSHSTFNQVMFNVLTPLDTVKENLESGKILLVQGQQGTALDTFIKGANTEQKNTAADLIAVYSVKWVLNQLSADVKVEMVNNNRAQSTGKRHDSHAMKVKFATQAAAQAFCDRLFDEHGIHSYTFGAGTPKTAQNGAVYLTEDDLERIAQTSGIVKESGSGKEAYKTKKDQKLLVRTEVNDVANEEIRRPGIN